MDTYNLWVAAVNHYQQEGTMLFDLLRPTLDLTGPHAELDLRRLKNLRGCVFCVHARVSVCFWDGACFAIVVY